MTYKIRRECWNEHTYNGYVDNPYWCITLDGNQLIGLKDSGEWWEISRIYFNKAHVEQNLNKIIEECKLNIVLKEVKQ